MIDKRTMQDFLYQRMLDQLRDTEAAIHQAQHQTKEKHEHSNSGYSPGF